MGRKYDMKLMDVNHSTMVVLDQGAKWDRPASHIVHWTEIDVPAEHYSIPLLVEKQVESLRSEYLAWVHDLGEYRIRGKTLREHLRLDDRFSFWWMTLIAEKSPIKSSGIYTVFKLRVLERFYLESGCQGMILCSRDNVLHQTLSEWFQQLGHSYQWDCRLGYRQKLGVRGWLRQLLPYPFQAIASLLWQLWIRRRYVKPVKSVPSEGHQVTIVSYFPNIDLTWASQGVFRSRYWEALHDLLSKGPWQINWVLIYERTEQGSFVEMVKLLRRFEQNPDNSSRFFFLEEFITAKVVFHTLMAGLNLLLESLILPVHQAFCFSGSALNFWPVLAQDWYASLRGSVAINGCFMLEIFQTMVRILPYQEWGLYLYENQLWERALVRAWQRTNNGKLIGFQHSVVRYLDLRYFEDERSYQLKIYPPPLPDVVALNGRGSEQWLENIEALKDRSKPVEALRYLYLNQYVKSSSDSVTRPDRHTLLVITGNSPTETSAQIYLLAQVAQKGGLNGYPRISIKPHPNCSVEPILRDVVPRLDVKVVHDHLSVLWQQVSAVYTANSTAASLEAIWTGLPVLVHVVEDAMNLSPLLGWPNMTFVTTVNEAMQWFAHPQISQITPDYFYLDEDLWRWQNLLQVRTAAC